MAAGGDVTVEFGFAGDIEDESVWVDTTGDLIDCSLGFGRQNPAYQWGANEAYVLLRDLDRDYDPANTAGTYYGFGPGIRARIRVKDDDGTVRRIFLGTVRKWEPQYDGSGNSGTVLVTISDYAGLLNQPMPFFADDFLARKLAQGPGCDYVFNTSTVNTTTGVVRDQSGQGRDGLNYDNWSSQTDFGASLLGTIAAGTSRLDQNSTDILGMGVAPLDAIRDGNGWFAYLDATLDATPSNTFGGLDNWYLIGQGRNQADTNRWHLYLTVTTATGLAELRLSYRAGTDGETIVTMTIGTGTPATYVSTKRRLFGVGVDGDTITLFAAVPEGGTGTLNPAGDTLVTETFTYIYPGPQSEDATTGEKNTWLGRREAASSTPTTMDVYRTGIVHAGADEPFCTGFATAYRDRGPMDFDAENRWDNMLGQLATPAGFNTTTLDTAIEVSQAGLLGFKTVLEFGQTLATMGRGRLFCQPSTGVLHLEDEDATSTSSGSTWTDQGTALTPSWRAGTHVVTDGYDPVVNDVSVELPNGYQARAFDQTSVDTYGVRSRAYQLPFNNPDDADAWATALVARFKDPAISVKFMVDLKVDAYGWDAVIACDEIGDTAVWQRQELETGPVTSTTLELGGERWAWSMDQQAWNVTLYLEPNRT